MEIPARKPWCEERGTKSAVRRAWHQQRGSKSAVRRVRCEERGVKSAAGRAHRSMREVWGCKEIGTEIAPQKRLAGSAAPEARHGECLAESPA